MLAQDLGRLDDRHFGCDRTVGPNLEREFVVVSFLADARFFDAIANTDHRAVNGVDWNDADFLDVLAMLRGRDVAAAIFNDHFHDERYVDGKGRQDMARIQHFDRFVGFNIASEYRAGGALFHAQDPGGFAVVFYNHRFDVEHDVSDVFEYAFDRGEFVLCVVNFDLSDGTAFQAG